MIFFSCRYRKWFCILCVFFKYPRCMYFVFFVYPSSYQNNVLDTNDAYPFALIPVVLRMHGVEVLWACFLWREFGLFVYMNKLFPMYDPLLRSYHDVLCISILSRVDRVILLVIPSSTLSELLIKPKSDINLSLNDSLETENSIINRFSESLLPFCIISKRNKFHK